MRGGRVNRSGTCGWVSMSNSSLSSERDGNLRDRYTWVLQGSTGVKPNPHCTDTARGSEISFAYKPAAPNGGDAHLER